MLIDYGFKLYDEIFDYSFDLSTDIEERCEAIASQVSTVVKIPAANLIDIYDRVSAKIEYNYNHAIKLVLDTANIPTIMTEEFRGLGNLFRAGHIIDFILHTGSKQFG